MKNERIRVLLVENDEVDRMAFTRMIDEKKMNYELTKAVSVSEARDILEKNEFDIMVLDFQLGDGTAFDVIELQDKIPIIITTGSGDEDIAVKAMKSGVYEYLVKDVDGKYLKRIPNVIKTVLDKHQLVEEKRLAENALKEAEERYNALFNRSMDAVYLNDFDGNFIDANKAALDLMGYSIKEIPTLNISSLLSDDQIPKAFEAIEEIMISGAQKELTEFKLRRKNGEYVWVETKSSMIFKDGEPYAIQGIARNITKRKEAEDSLMRKTHTLGERVKELNTLYRISELIQKPDISMDELLQRTVDGIPPGWQYPEITCARITFDGNEYKTKQFKETKWKQENCIFVHGTEIGVIEVFFNKEMPEIDEGPFLVEERNLILAIAETLGRFIEHRRIQETLKDSEERFRTLTEGTNDVAYKMNSDGIMVYVSPQIIQYGIEPEDIVSNGLEKYIHPDDKESVLEDFLRTISEGAEFPTLFRIINKRGEIFWMEDMGKIQRDEDGNISGITGILRDVTSRKKMEEALLESEEKFRTISASAQDAIIMIDNDGRVTFWNEAAEKIFGYSDDELYGNEIHKFIVPSEYLDAIAEGFKEFRSTGQGGAVGKTMILKGKRKDGTIFPVELSMSSVKLQGKWCAVGIIRDITEREKAHKRLQEMNEELIQADKLKDSYLSITSHELRNPLAGIIGVLELLQEGLYKDQDELMEFIRTMHVTSKDMLAILNDLLDLQKVGAGKIELEFEEFDVTETFDELNMLYGRELKESGIEFEIKPPPEEDRTINSDRKRLKEVLTNLVSNARKFTESGSITIQARKQDGDTHLFEVIDTGIGIKPEDQKELFIPFSQLHRKTKKKIKGTGLGLAICKSIVEALGGKIWIESEGEGKGTKVSFTIPLSKGNEPA